MGCVTLKEGALFEIKLPSGKSTVQQSFLAFDEFGRSIARLEIGSLGIIYVVQINNENIPYGSFFIDSAFLLIDQ